MDVIERLITDHDSVREHRDMSLKLAELINNDAFFWDNATKVSRFFNKEVREHFSIEEKVFFPVLKNVVPQEKLKMIAEIEKEHDPVIAKLDELDKISLQHLKYPSKSTRELFVKTCGEIIDILLPHAKREDDEIFLLTKQLFKETQYKELERLYFKYMEI